MGSSRRKTLKEEGSEVIQNFSGRYAAKAGAFLFSYIDSENPLQKLQKMAEHNAQKLVSAYYS